MIALSKYSGAPKRGNMFSYHFICCNSNNTRLLCLGQVSGPDFEIFVDVTPGSITIDSVEATVLPNVPNTTEANGEYLIQYFHTFLKNCFNNLILLCFLNMVKITAVKINV